MGEAAARTFAAVREPMQMEFDNTYTLKHEPFLLEQAWNALMGRAGCAGSSPAPGAL